MAGRVVSQQSATVWRESGASRPLPSVWRPTTLQIRLNVDSNVLEAAESELARRAATDADQCCGYFPALAGTPGIVDDVHACRRCPAACPDIEAGGAALRFNLLRRSLRRQAVVSAYLKLAGSKAVDIS